MRTINPRSPSRVRLAVSLGLALLTATMLGGTALAVARSSSPAASCMGNCDPRTGSGCHGLCSCIAVSSTRGRCIPTN